MSGRSRSATSRRLTAGCRIEEDERRPEEMRVLLADGGLGEPGKQDHVFPRVPEGAGEMALGRSHRHGRSHQHARIRHYTPRHPAASFQMASSESARPSRRELQLHRVGETVELPRIRLTVHVSRDRMPIR
jgi:hypothetical protein